MLVVSSESVLTVRDHVVDMYYCLFKNQWFRKHLIGLEEITLYTVDWSIQFLVFQNNRVGTLDIYYKRHKR